MNPNNPNPRDLDTEETPGNFSGRHQNSPYKFNQDEIRVLKECNRESFFKRCLPVGGILGFGTYYAVQSGYLRPNPRFGATPKVITAVIIGYFAGKFSYQSVCAEKLMQLPNSQIGEILRQRRRGNLQESIDPGFGPGMSLAPFGSLTPSDTYSDVGQQNPIDIDTNRPTYDGLDDSQRPSVDNPIYEEEMPPVQKHVTTYEELRKKNREEHQQKKIGNIKEPMKTTPMPTPNSEPPRTREESDRFDITPPSITRRNKYGDPME